MARAAVACVTPVSSIAVYTVLLISISMMRFPPSLTRDELRLLAQQSKPGSTERRLLWEIKRLRAVALRANQLMEVIDPLAGAPGVIYEALRAELEAEACVREDRTSRKVILDQGR